MSIEAAFYGSLPRPAEVKTSKAGRQYVKLGVRVESGEKATFINVTAFDQDAIAVADKLVAGARVYCEGKLSLDEWTAQDGSKRTGLSCVSFHCRLSQIGRNKPRREEPKRDFPRDMHAPLGKGAAGMNDDIPFAPEVR